MRTFVCAAWLTIALPLGACASAQAPAPPAALAAPAPGTAAAPSEGDVDKPLGEAKVGDKTSCPVMKHPFVVTESSPSYAYEGKTYYFCCPGCIERFKAEPKKYLMN